MRGNTPQGNKLTGNTSKDNTLRDKTLRDNILRDRSARVWAARHNTSVSRILGELLAERMRMEDGYELAMQTFLARKPKRLRKKSEAYPARERLHER